MSQAPKSSNQGRLNGPAKFLLECSSGTHAHRGSMRTPKDDVDGLKTDQKSKNFINEEGNVFFDIF